MTDTDIVTSPSNTPITADSELILEFNQDFSFVRCELLDTLKYVENQLSSIEEKTRGVARFSRNIFETKKLFVEQKLSLLKQLSSLAIDKKRNKAEGDGDMPNISDILGGQEK